MKWEPVIGLEVHVQLATRSKIFSGASTQYGAEPNTQACFIDLGYPGVLPVLNEKAVTMAIRFGLAVDAQIHPLSVFARKNYFYPDLPKGYQISQFEDPIVQHGRLGVLTDKGEVREIPITRAHLEEDAGKSLHEDFQGQSGIDLNRAGTPLLEIVSAPEIYSAKEAVAYLKALHALVRYLKISDGNMQEGSFRCDANVSLRPVGSKTLGTRTETKNVNSFRFVERAILFEIERQAQILDAGGQIVQETRLYDANKNETRPLRSKEEANDYRYFPDPDLLPVQVTAEQIQKIRETLPELPQQKRERFMRDYALNLADAHLLTQSEGLADYYETAVQTANLKQWGDGFKIAANWIMGDLLGAFNKHQQDMATNPIPAEQMGLLVARILDGTISGKIGKTVFELLWDQQGAVDQLIAEKGLKQVTDTSLIDRLIAEVIAAHPDEVTSYKEGKDKLFGFFVGQVMKLSKGKANPGEVNERLKKALS